MLVTLTAKQPVPLRLRGLEERLDHDRAGMVEEHRRRPELRHAPRDRRLDLPLPPRRRREPHLPPRPPPRPPPAVAAAASHCGRRSPPCALGREQPRRRAPHAGGAPGDDRDLPLEPPHRQLPPLRKISAIPATTSAAPAQAPAAGRSPVRAQSIGRISPARSPTASRRCRPCPRRARRATASCRPRAPRKARARSRRRPRRQRRPRPRRRDRHCSSSVRHAAATRPGPARRRRDRARRHHRPGDHRAQRLPARRPEPERHAEPERPLDRLPGVQLRPALP